MPRHSAWTRNNVSQCAVTSMTNVPSTLESDLYTMYAVKGHVVALPEWAHTWAFCHLLDFAYSSKLYLYVPSWSNFGTHFLI